MYFNKRFNNILNPVTASSAPGGRNKRLHHASRGNSLDQSTQPLGLPVPCYSRENIYTHTLVTARLGKVNRLFSEHCLNLWVGAINYKRQKINKKTIQFCGFEVTS